MKKMKKQKPSPEKLDRNALMRAKVHNDLERSPTLDTISAKHRAHIINSRRRFYYQGPQPVKD